MILSESERRHETKYQRQERMRAKRSLLGVFTDRPSAVACRKQALAKHTVEGTRVTIHDRTVRAHLVTAYVHVVILELPE